jgi:uncharacterized membrane protein YphA (DoxX/SURF4 family)
MNKEVEMSVLDWLFLALRFAVAAVFISYGIGKLQDVNGFTAALRRYKFISPKTSVYLARVIPPVEILLGALLLLNIMPVSVVFVLMALLVVFSGALVYSQLTSKALAKDCGCGGSRSVSYKNALIRNAVLSFALLSIIGGAAFAELGQSLLLTTLQTVSLLLIVARSFAIQSRKFQHLLAIAGGSHAAKQSAERANDERITSVSGRRAFLRVAGVTGLSVLSLAVFGRTPTALADAPYCACNTPTSRGFWDNPNCSCCNSCYASCGGYRIFWRVYGCDNNSSIDCDIRPQYYTIICYC